VFLCERSCLCGACKSTDNDDNNKKKIRPRFDGNLYFACLQTSTISTYVLETKALCLLKICTWLTKGWDIYFMVYLLPISKQILLVTQETARTEFYIYRSSFLHHHYCNVQNKTLFILIITYINRMYSDITSKACTSFSRIFKIMLKIYNIHETLDTFKNQNWGRIGKFRRVQGRCSLIFLYKSSQKQYMQLLLQIENSAQAVKWKLKCIYLTI
jgi:hypothetical protein